VGPETLAPYDLVVLNYQDRQPIPGAGLNQPSLWTLSYGQGRVFADVLGHNVVAVNTLGFVTTFTRGAEWAATGAVTLTIPPEMRQ
jgi:type 1 glutamine amidotransferase